MPAEVGDSVRAGVPLIVLEAMKTQLNVTALGDGVVEDIQVKDGEQLTSGQVLAALEAADAG